ncbi:FAD-dependent oxidoreductase [Microlunatus sp. Y2014]|uniref:FAD-dependent oxidoreductase n=1 Tax=Microlunatus sp. Y2014 TaxID=3418488 RepID=UPI003DA7456C
MAERQTEILVVGGGLGGVAAALAAARLGHQVVLTEHTDWLGGQMTAQAVPPDENAWIEDRSLGNTSYIDVRERIRQHYRDHFPLTDEARNNPKLNPGMGGVSRLCHEAPVAVKVLNDLVAEQGDRITVLLEHQLTDVHTDGDSITAASFSGPAGDVTIAARYVLDATELGDVLELGNVESVIGAEAKSDTGELHAVDVADPMDQQAITWCFAIDHRPGEDHTIDRPARYDEWKTRTYPFWPGSQLSFDDVHPVTLEHRNWQLLEPEGGVDPDGPRALWRYRQIRAGANLVGGTRLDDVTLVNWPMIDYWEAPLVGVTPAERAAALEGSRSLSLSFLYWMQTEAPNADGGTGYPGLRLRPDLTGTEDGLAKDAYIREARRIQSEFTVLEQHIGVAARPQGVGGAEQFDDSVGIGFYRIDLHPSTAPRTYVDVNCHPFQIPLGSLIPVRVDNLIPVNKNIGTTHITNGAYRLHPVEWAIGEAAGVLVHQAIERRLPPRGIRSDANELADLQRLLTSQGVDLAWPADVREEHDLRVHAPGAST